MSSKINVFDIITGHISTLKNSGSNKLSKLDLITFFGIPFIFALTGMFYGYNLSSDVINIFVNFGSIFTALLLSVLVLIYDQENKLDDKKSSNNNVPFYDEKKIILNDLYFSICYCVVASMALVFVSTLDAVFVFCREISINDFFLKISANTHLLTPISIFLAVNIILTILMIVKRMHMLLTTQN